MEFTTREVLAAVDVEGGAFCDPSDNLSIVLCTYFSQHCDRPEDDEENEDNHYWGDWVCQKCDEALDRISAAVEKGDPR
jgi:hypothetical protein